jgi:hypothetical protein
LPTKLVHHFSSSSQLQAQFEAAPVALFSVESLHRSSNDAVTSMSVSLPVTHTLTCPAACWAASPGPKRRMAAQLNAVMSF